jgi:hypothetical protein
MAKKRINKRLVATKGLEGLTEVRDTQTGAVVEREPTPDTKKPSRKKTVPPKPKVMQEIRNYQDQVVVAPRGTAPEDLGYSYWTYSPITCDLVCRKIGEGKSLSAICRERGMPPLDAIFRWRRDHPEFDAQIREAKRMRAEYFEEKAIEAAEEAKESTAKASRLKFDAYSWGAEVNDRSQYGKQTKVTGDPSQPIAFTVVTGVPEITDQNTNTKPEPKDVPNE